MNLCESLRQRHTPRACFHLVKLVMRLTKPAAVFHKDSELNCPEIFSYSVQSFRSWWELWFEALSVREGFCRPPGLINTFKWQEKQEVGPHRTLASQHLDSTEATKTCDHYDSHTFRETSAPRHWSLSDHYQELIDQQLMKLMKFRLSRVWKVNLKCLQQ